MKKIFLFFVFLDALHSFLEMKTGYNSRFLDCFSSGILCFVDLRFAKKYNFHSSSYIMREIWIPLLNIPMYIYISKISIIRIWGQKLFNVSRSTVFWKKERGRNVSISRFRLVISVPTFYFPLAIESSLIEIPRIEIFLDRNFRPLSFICCKTRFFYNSPR